MASRVFSRRVFGWWLVAERLCRRMTAPPADRAESDRKVEQLLVESFLWRSGNWIALQIRAAWLESRCRSWARALARDWVASDRIVRLRAIGWIMTVSAATTLGLQALGSEGVARRGWMMPAAVAAAGLVLLGFAHRTRAVRSRPSSGCR